jgi:hypothetical protein
MIVSSIYDSRFLIYDLTAAAGAKSAIRNHQSAILLSR